MLKQQPRGGGFWTRAAAAVCYMVAFGAIIGAVGFLIPALANGSLGAAAASVGISAAVGIAAVLGSTYLNGKIDAAKETGATAQKSPAIIVAMQPSLQKEQGLANFRERLEAERACASVDAGRVV